MSFHHSVAKAVRLRKAKRPDLYCPHPGCLWTVASGVCPKHHQEQYEQFLKEAEGMEF